METNYKHLRENKKSINQKIQKELLANPSIDTFKLSEKYNVSSTLIGANRRGLVTKGLLNRSDINKAIETSISKLNKVSSAYEKAKKTSLNTYSNHNGENKEVARTKMSNYIVDSGVVGLIPTLPNTTWAIEQKIEAQTKGNEFIGVECNEPTFKKMKLTLKKLKLNATTVLGYIGGLLYGKLENTYAHLILDYCGNLATISKEVEYSINNDIVKVGGIMAITFSKPIRGTDSQSEKLKGLACINNSDDRCLSDRGVEAYFNKITGWNYQVMEFFYYQDTYPMTLVIIKRIK